MTATTLDPVRKTNTTLSGGNLIATSSGAGGACSSRMLSGFTYFEATPTTLTGTPSVGIAMGTWNTSTGLQSGTNTLAYLASGAVQINGVTLATIATWAQGNRIDCAIDPLNKQIWFRVAGGNWNNNVANVPSANPAVAVGGIDFSSIVDGSLEAAVYASVAGNVWSLAFSSASWAGAAPSGAVSLDAISYSAVAEPANDLMPGASPSAGSFTSQANPATRGKHFSPAGALTNVSGVTKELGAVVAGRKVELYDRVTGDLLGFTYSAADGTWSIPCLGRPSVRVVGSDPTTYNSIVYDNVIPA